MKTMKIFKSLTGITFTVMGPFLVGNCTSKSGQFKLIPVSKHGQELVAAGTSTKSHTHSFLSVYKSDNLNVISGKETYTLPTKAIVLVPEKENHSWIPKNKTGSVGSVDPRHRKQVLV